MDVMGVGGFGSGRYRLKNRFFSRRLVIVKPPVSIKHGTNVFFSKLKLRNSYRLSISVLVDHNPCRPCFQE